MARYNGPDNLNDGANSLAVNPDGTAVYVTGHSAGSASFDDYATIAYNTATGAQLWAARYNGPPNEPDMAKSAGVSADGRTVYVTGVAAGAVVTGGYTIECTTIAYNTATGASRWVRRYPGIANTHGGTACCITVSPKAAWSTSPGTQTPRLARTSRPSPTTADPCRAQLSRRTHCFR